METILSNFKIISGVLLLLVGIALYTYISSLNRQIEEQQVVEKKLRVRITNLDNAVKQRDKAIEDVKQDYHVANKLSAELSSKNENLSKQLNTSIKALQEAEAKNEVTKNYLDQLVPVDVVCLFKQCT